MKSLALEVSTNQIRVNCVHPTSVATPMIVNDVFPTMTRMDIENPTMDDAAEFLTDKIGKWLSRKILGDVTGTLRHQFASLDGLDRLLREDLTDLGRVPPNLGPYWRAVRFSGARQATTDREGPFRYVSEKPVFGLRP